MSDPERTGRRKQAYHIDSPKIVQVFNLTRKVRPYSRNALQTRGPGLP